MIAQDLLKLCNLTLERYMAIVTLNQSVYINVLNSAGNKVVEHEIVMLD